MVSRGLVGMVRGLPFALALLGLVVAALVGRAEGIEAKCSAGAIVGVSSSRPRS